VVTRLAAGGPEWDEVVGPLAAARLNAPLTAEAIYRLSPADQSPG
jgi:hypothetical protein